MSSDQSGVVVNLDSAEVMQAAVVGCMRTINGIKGRVDRHGMRSAANGWQHDIEGCLAEFAVAKLLNLHWCGVGRPGTNDVGLAEEVRSTEYANGHLLLHDDDKNDRRYWLVTGARGAYVVRGWILASEGKQQGLWREPVEGRGRHCYCVPQAMLHPPTRLMPDAA